MKTSKERIVQNKTENKKVFWKFLLTIMVCLAGGFVAGIAMVMAGKGGWPNMLAEGVRSVLCVAAPYGAIVCTTIVLAITIVLEQQSKKLYAIWDGEDEEILAQMEGKTSYILVLHSMNMILGYFFLAAGFYVVLEENMTGSDTMIKLAVVLIGTAYQLTTMMLFQKRAVDFTKELNPEKKGSIYDQKFKKKWLESCDEAEKFQIYKASYKSYSATNSTCIVLWMFSTMGMFVWDFGFLPMTMVIIIWASANLAYGRECIHLSKHPSEIMK